MPRSPLPRTSLLTLCVALAPLGAAPVLAEESAQPVAEARAIDVPAGSLDQALNRLAAQAGVTLSAPSALLADRRTDGLQGRFTLRQALERLLAGTGLSYRLDDSGTVTVQAAGQASGKAGPLRLDPILVEAVPQSDVYGRDGLYQSVSSGFALGGTSAPLKETPFSASVLEEDFLRDSNLQRLDRAATYAPGVQTGNQVNNTSQVFVSRGFQLGRDSILINGSRQSDAFSITPEELVSKLEFYRGPASVLSGVSPPGGAANIVTKKPLGEAFRRLEVSYDQHEQRKLAGDFNSGRITDWVVPVAFRLNAMVEDSESFRDDVNREVHALAPVATIDLTPDTRLTLEANIIDWEANDDRGLPLVDDGSSEDGADRFAVSDFLLGTTEQVNDREQIRYFVDLSHRWNEHLTTNLQATYGETERSQFAIFPTQFDAATGTLARAHFGTEDKFESADIRLDTQFRFRTGILEHEGLAAIQYRDFQREDNFTAFEAQADTINVNNPDPDRPFVAASGPAGGVQLENDSKEYLIQDAIRVAEGPLEGVQLVAGGRWIVFDDDVDPSQDQKEWISRFGLGYTPPALSWITVFSNYSESFDAQGGVDTQGDPLGPQNGEQWEIGAKAFLLEDRLTLSLAYFDLENNNVSAPDPNSPDGSLAIGTQENQGVELEAVGQLTRDLQVQAQYTFNDSEIRNDQDLAGNELPLAPDHSGSVWVRYDVPADLSSPLGAGRLVLTGGAVHVGDRFVDVNNGIALDSYTRGDLGARYILNEQTELALNILNVSDTRFFTGGNGFGLGSVTPGQERTVSLSLAHEF